MAGPVAGHHEEENECSVVDFDEGVWRNSFSA
jgi:hypothetical protein